MNISDGRYPEGCVNESAPKGKLLMRNLTLSSHLSHTRNFDSNAHVCNVETTCLYYWECFSPLYSIHGTDYLFKTRGLSVTSRKLFPFSITFSGSWLLVFS
jgi:hypothetical protein